MTDIVKQETGVVQNWTEEELKIGKETREELEQVVCEIHSQEKKLETNFVVLGTLIEEIREKKLWLMWDHRSFNSFLETIAPRIGKGRSRLYACAGIAKQLLPYIAPDDLEDIGITKASAIAAAVKNAGGKKPSDKLITEAQKPETTLEQLNDLLVEDYGIKDQGEVGTWYSLAGIFLSPEEKEEFLRAVRVACKVDPVLDHIIDDWQDASAPQRKEVLFRWLREFLAEYESQVEKGTA